MATTATDGPIVTAALSDDRFYAFDCSKAPELAAGTGITISSGTIIGGTGLSFGSVTVLAAVFDGIPIGKGLKVRAYGGVAGTVYGLACLVTLSDGSKFTVPGRMAKVADYDT